MFGRARRQALGGTKLNGIIQDVFAFALNTFAAVIAEVRPPRFGSVVADEQGRV
jgi:hypothetical protein